MREPQKWQQQTGGGILVISEGVFGMRGEQGRLKEIVELKKKYNFRFLVDDAHGFGTLGKTGAGAGEEQGVQDGYRCLFCNFCKIYGKYRGIYCCRSRNYRLLKI